MQWLDTRLTHISGAAILLLVAHLTACPGQHRADDTGRPTTVDLVVALSGEDTATCGTTSSPCRTVKYTVEQRAEAGQLIGVMPGTYDEIGGIDLPKRVGITGMGADATEVVLRPNYAADALDFFINLVDEELDQVGDQSLSYLSLEAHAASHVGWRAVQIQNRDDVRIHHCHITNWDRKDRIKKSSAVFVSPSEKLPFPRKKWAEYLPDELGPAGDYSTWTIWPQHPIRHFEFDHSFVYRSGARMTNEDGSLGDSYRPGGALVLYTLKDSSIHDNEFDTRGLFAKNISAIGAYWDNVDTYRNIFRVTSAEEERWMGPSPTWTGTFALETWMHINGCEWYDNVSNDGWSIAKHKDSEVRNNVILRHRARSIGIEVALIDHSAVYHNYVLGGRNMGISNRQTQSHNQDNGWIYGNILVNVDHWAIRSSFDKGVCSPKCGDITNMFIYGNLVDHTKWSGIAVYANCESESAPLEIGIRNNIVLNAGGRWNGITFQVSDTFGTMTASIENNLCFDNGGGNDVLCNAVGGGDCSAVVWDGINETHTIAQAPLFTGSLDTTSGSPDVVIVNDDNTSATRRQGRWTTGTGADIRAYPEDGDVAVHSAGAGDWFEFQASDLSPDRPTVIALWWPRNFAANRSSAVPVTVYDGNDPTPIFAYTVNQSTWDSSEWYYLGRHVFRSGHARLRVHSVADGSVVADAALWVKLGYGYRLAAGSPAIGAGSHVANAVVTEDFFGNPVPLGSGPDIGIHEQ